ncbi:hypothetical protein ACOR62_07240 [Neisseria lisongii]|uniref:Uncharacterized protein n=1 Tax=Neisseria lisongii TaxID=2912188 RepID=A0AAW5ASK7_9NEIS|nr:hypothetical protein [Neisseria lisongii]MCF7530378.1 hypothetical protein [Neisseria lisongii]
MKKTALFLSLAATLLAAQPALAKWKEVGSGTCGGEFPCTWYMGSLKVATASFKNGEKIRVLTFPIMEKFTPPVKLADGTIFTKNLHTLQISCDQNENYQGYHRKVNRRIVSKTGKNSPVSDGKWSQEPEQKYVEMCRNLLNN